MKLTLKHAGGLAAGVRRPPRVLDASSLTTPDKNQLSQFVASAIAEHSTEKQNPGPYRDGMSYMLTIDMNGNLTDLRGSDAAMTPAFAKLLDWLERCFVQMDSKQT
jgi:hypothetical protein